MSKFVIECPNCGRFAEARTGFFARKRIDCACGFVINVRTDKLTSRKCAHCGNDVVFDQSRGDKARCPVCHELINELSDKTRVEEFSCAQCGVKLIAAKNANTYTCPVCDCVNDVQKQLMQEHIKHDGLASIIKYEGDNETLVWKHPVEDFNLGSQLIVHESQEAIFFRDGQALDLFGAGRYTLETQQLPILEKLYNLPTDTDGTFHSDVYYINLTTQMGIKWGTDSKVRMFDPASGMHIEIGASGEFNIRVTNSRKLLMKLVGTAQGMKQEDIFGGKGSKGYFRSMIMTRVKSYLAQVIKDNGYNILEIDYRLQELSESLQERINADIADYGLTMPGFFVNSVITPDDDPNVVIPGGISTKETTTTTTRTVTQDSSNPPQTEKVTQPQTEKATQPAQTTAPPVVTQDRIVTSAPDIHTLPAVTEPANDYVPPTESHFTDAAECPIGKVDD